MWVVFTRSTALRALQPTCTRPAQCFFVTGGNGFGAILFQDDVRPIDLEGVGGVHREQDAALFCVSFYLGIRFSPSS